jgi:lipopolysaccharide export system protein LptA
MPRAPLLVFMRFITLLVVMAGLASPAFAQAKQAPKPANAGPAAPFAGFGSNSKEPIKVDAGKLEVFDKENRAVYSGDVVTVQGQTIMRCAKMTVYYSQQNNNQTRPAANAGAIAPAPAPRPAATGGGTGESSVKQIDCDGNVSILSGTQSATSNFLRYEAAADTVTLTGSVVIADCDNVQRGEKVVYDVKTGKATVDAGPTGRVQGIFTPGSDDKKDKKASPAGECASPATAAPNAAPSPKAAADSKGKTR